MRARIQTLLNRDRTQIVYPITKDDAIYNENNQPLSDELKKYREPDYYPARGSDKMVTSDGIARALEDAAGSSAYERPIQGLITSQGPLETSEGQELDVTTLSQAETVSMLINMIGR